MIVAHMSFHKRCFHKRYWSSLIFATIAVAGNSLLAQPITVPNFSFESQPAPNSFPFVNIFVDSWEKAPEPAYYGPAIGTPFGIPWIGTAGVFLDVNPYANHNGVQAGYILGFPQVTLFQDYNSSPAHDFNATFNVGSSYNLTIGVFGKSTLAPGSTLQLSLYLPRRRKQSGDGRFYHCDLQRSEFPDQLSAESC